jgi:hypothetical protein
MAANSENSKGNVMTQTKELDKIVDRPMPHGNVAFQIRPEDILTNRNAATRNAAKRRDRKSRTAAKCERIERQKELGKDSPMDVDAFEAAVEFVRAEFGIVLNSSWGSFTTRPRITERELFALCAAVDDGTTYRDRVLAVRRLSKLGFRVQFVGMDPRLQ